MTPEEKKEVVRKRASDWYYANRERIKPVHNARIIAFRINNPEKYHLIAARQRAKRHGIEFNLDLSDIVIPEVCPILKKPFARKTQYASSLDRIDPSKGYIKGNVQVISRKANVMKNDATEDELREFYNWLKTKFQ